MSLSDLPDSLLLVWQPFVTSAPLWNYWPLLLLPLVAGVSVVYKTTKCRYVHQIPKEALGIAVYILSAIIGLAITVYVVVYLTE